MTTRWFARLFLAAAVGMAGWTLVAGCTSFSDQDGSAAGGKSGKGGGGGQGGGAASEDSGASAAGGGGGVIDKDVAGDATCAGESKKAEPTPVDIYMMFDRSASMAGNKWNGCKTAITTFVQSPKVAGLGLGLQFFPFPDALNCNVNTYATPSAAIAPLPGNAQSILTALNVTAPDGLTPTLPALQGAVQHATKWKSQNPTHKVVILLVTDGEPNICNSTIQAVANVASQSAQVGQSVFVVGVQDPQTNLQNLNTIAQAGGTQKAYLISDANAAQEFLDALLKIAGAILACEYTVPVPPAGQIDPGKTNVDYAPGDGGPTETFGKVANQAACGAKTDAFYFDDEQKPTKVLLCPETCKKVSADAKGSIAVRYGCSAKIY